MFSFILLINLIHSQPQDVGSQEEKCVTTAIVTGDYAGITTYCPDFDPECRNKDSITVPENSACTTDCSHHSGGAWCLVNGNQWSFCKNQTPHPCPETCQMGFDAGQACSDGYRREESLDDAFCSSEDPPSGVCDFSGNEEHMLNCCISDPTISPTVSFPSKAPSSEPTSSIPTKSPFTSFPTSLPTIDCTQFEERDTCDPTLGCAFVGETCEHTCPKWPGLSPPQSWITEAHEITVLASDDLFQCDFECRSEPTCSVFLSDTLEEVCVLYDTHMPEDVALVSNANVTTGFCHTTFAPSQSPSQTPSGTPSITPSNLPSPFVSKSPSQAPLVSTLCPFEGMESEACDDYCTDLCYFTPKCRDYVPGNPDSISLSHERPRMFTFGVDSAPDDFFSPAVASSSGQVCSCKSMKNNLIPGMGNSTCLMSAEITTDSEAEDDEEEAHSAWVAVGVMSCILCCIVSLLLLFCCAGKHDEEEDEKEQVLLEDPGTFAEPERKREPEPKVSMTNSEKHGGGDITPSDRED